MKLEDVRNILAVQAVEQTDREHEIVSQQDRHEAARLAGAPLEKNPSKSRENSFLADRAARLSIDISSRVPESATWLHAPASRHRMGLLTLLLCVAAVVCGYLTNELGPEKRINILSFPLLGILGWSLIVYVRELVLLFRSRKQLFEDNWLDALVRYCLPAIRPSGNEDEPLQAARHLFQSRWQRLLVPAVGCRIKSILHLVAFLLAASAIGGMYVKGLAHEYRAVWESTFFEKAEDLRPFVHTILGPAAALKGDAFPSAEELRAIQWRGNADPVAGENAARWIHWYALTIAIYVLLPRAILSIIWRIRSAAYTRTIPFRDVDRNYFEHLLATSTGEATDVRFLPYPAAPDKNSKEDIEDLLEHELGRAVEGSWDDAVPFGDEDSFELPNYQAGEEFIPVFSFAATPETEAHLALFRNLQDQTGNEIRHIVLDTYTFDRKNETFPDADERRESREKAWNRLFAKESVDLILTGIRAQNSGVTAD